MPKPNTPAPITQRELREYVKAEDRLQDARAAFRRRLERGAKVRPGKWTVKLGAHSGPPIDYYPCGFDYPAEGLDISESHR